MKFICDDGAIVHSGCYGSMTLIFYHLADFEHFVAIFTSSIPIMSNHLSLQQRMCVLNSHIRSYGVYKTIRREFEKPYPGDTISPKAVRRIIEKFEHTGSLYDAARSGRPASSRSEVNVTAVKNAFEANPKFSIGTAGVF